MFCSNCGERIDPDSHFCVHCGNKVGQSKPKQTAISDQRIKRRPSQTPVHHNDMQSDTNNDTQPLLHNDMRNWTDDTAHFADYMGMPEGTSNLNQFHETSVYEDMIAYVGKNGHYYDQKWKTMNQSSSKRSWNFAAFFLTIFWLGYRRLSKEMFVIIGSLFVLGIVNIYIGWDATIMQFINFGIGLVVGIGLGLYGNYLYRRHVEKSVNHIRSLARSQDEKIGLLQAKGGSSTGGVIGAIVVFAIYFGIMYYLLFSVFGAITQVKHGNLYDYPDVTVGDAFDDFFDSGKWKHQQSKANFKQVEYSGIKTFEGEEHDIKIDFIIDSDDEFHFDRIIVDDDELDRYDYTMFIDFIFNDSAGLQYW